MGTRGAIAIMAVCAGCVLAVLLFVPYVARQYRRRGRFGVGRAALAGAWLVYLVALLGFVLLPLPSDITALCARGGTRPQWWPFYVIGDLARSHTGTGLVSWLASPPLVPLLFNVVLFVPMGMLVRHLFGRGRLVTIAIGFGCSLFVECTQLTGNWFLYPCAYRQFNVDDLIANTAGTAIGVLLAPTLHLIDRAPVAVPDSVTVGRRWLGMGCDGLACGMLGLFLATVPPEVDQSITSNAWFPCVDACLAWWVPGVALFVLPSLTGVGGSVGQRSVLLAPVGPDGDPPGARRRVGRVMAGSGGYALLGGIAGVYSPGIVVLAVFVVASLVAAALTRGHRGLSGVLAGLELRIRACGPQPRRCSAEPG